MPKSKPGKSSRAWVGGYEVGSVYDRMTREQQKAYRAWKKQKDADSHQFERQLQRPQ